MRGVTKIVLRTMIVVVVAVLSLIYTDNAWAEMKPKTMTLNNDDGKLFTLDVDDDGITDEIKIENKIVKDCLNIKLYVNDKEIFEHLVYNKDELQFKKGFDYIFDVTFTDIFENDKKKEMFFSVFEMSSSFNILTVQFDQDICSIIEGGHGIGSDGARIVKTDGNGRFTIDTWRDSDCFDSYYYYEDYELVDNFISPVADNKKSFKMTKDWKKHVYILDEKIKVYDKFKSKKVKFNLKKGDKLYFQEVRYEKAVKKTDSEFGDYYLFKKGWAKIKTKSGKVGWINGKNKLKYHNSDGGVNLWS